MRGSELHCEEVRLSDIATEPLGEGPVGPVEDLVPFLRPRQGLGLLGPEGEPVLGGVVVEVGMSVGVRRELRRGVEAAVFVHEVGQRV